MTNHIQDSLIVLTLISLGFLFQAELTIPLASNTEYIIQHYTIDEGLPVNSINGIIQDENGYLYLSTYDGLVQYDGYEFVTFNSGNTEGIRTNRFAGVLKGKDNTLWMINDDGTITSKKSSDFKTYDISELPGAVIRIMLSKKGVLWVTGGEGVAWFDEETGTFIEIKDTLFLAGSGVLEEGLNGEILIVNEIGLISIQNKKVDLLLRSDEMPLTSGIITNIKQLRRGAIWLMGDGGLFRFNTSSKKTDYEYIMESEGLHLWNANIWKFDEIIFTGNNGFYVFNLGTEKIRKLPLAVNSNQLRYEIIFEGNGGEDVLIGDTEVVIDGQVVLETQNIRVAILDNEGSIWVGTGLNGIYQIRKSSFTNLTSQTIPGFTNIYSIVEGKDGSKWACSFSNGIFRLGKEQFQNWTSSNSKLENNLCKLIFIDSKGTVYAGLNNEGLWTFDGNEWNRFEKFEKLPSKKLRTSEAFFEQGNTLLVGGFHSLATLNGDNSRLFDTNHPTGLSGVQFIGEDEKGNLFLGTSSDGVVRISGNRYTSYSAKNGNLNSNAVRDIFFQSDDTLWVVNESKGLNRLVLDNEGSVISTFSVTVSEGLYQNSLHRIIDDMIGNFWISGNRGIMRISKKELNAYANGETSGFQVQNFDEKDGMINREANGGVQSAGILVSDGRIWFPNQAGITIIDPNDFSPNSNLATPNPVFESVEYDNGVLFPNSDMNITVPKKYRDLRVNFTAPNFSYQDRLHLSYKLDGVNENWQPADQSRQAVFTGIPPGSHELKIRSQYMGSLPAENSLTINVPDYFYETKGFYVILFFGMIGLVYSGFKVRLRSLKEAERKLQNRVNIQTKELQKAAEDKQRFFTGITHELKTPLSLIIGPLDDFMKDEEHTSDNKLSGRLSMMHRNSYRLKNLVDQILDVSKLNADAIKLKVQPVDLPQFTRQIAGQFQSKLVQEEVELNISSKEFDGYIYVDQEAWERIIINLMSNAIKFTPRKSSIGISFVENESTVEIKITDEGPGIKPEYQDKVFEYLYQIDGNKASEGTGIGLFLVKGLIEQMGGTIAVNSNIGKGTEFTVTLKKGHSHININHTLLHDPQLSDDKTPTPRKELVEDSLSADSSILEHSVLIVEDNYDFRIYLKSILNDLYSVMVAENGTSALKILEKETPNLIISDVMMPGMNGLDFVDALRKQDRLKGLPVIFLSSKNEEVDIMTGLSTGADVYLTKPIRSSMLLSQVAAVLRREKILLREGLSVLSQDKPELVQKIHELIYRQLANPSLNVNMLADTLFISRRKLYREWKEIHSTSINDFIKKIRLDESYILLKKKGFTVQEAARAVGYTDANYFSTSFKKAFGVPPSQLN